MVSLTKIYTKGGDKGRTSLSSGVRVFKNDVRIEAIGDVDEANCAIGYARNVINQSFPSLEQLLNHIQNDMFDLGADLATPFQKAKLHLYSFVNGSPTTDVSPEDNALRIIETQVVFLENKIDEYNALLQPLTSFILPGGSPEATALHMARAVTRRAERRVVSLMQQVDINPWSLKYLNRLSDLLFVLCRHVNDNGSKDILWKPGANR